MSGEEERGRRRDDVLDLPSLGKLHKPWARSVLVSRSHPKQLLFLGHRCGITILQRLLSGAVDFSIATSFSKNFFDIRSLM
jgi:hypothetical protein